MSLSIKRVFIFQLCSEKPKKKKNWNESRIVFSKNVAIEFAYQCPRHGYFIILSVNLKKIILIKYVLYLIINALLRFFFVNPLETITFLTIPPDVIINQFKPPATQKTRCCSFSLKKNLVTIPLRSKKKIPFFIISKNLLINRTLLLKRMF